MRPDDRPAKGGAGRLEQVRPANLLVTLGAQLGDDQVAQFIENEEAVAVLDQERIGRADLLPLVRLEALPDALAGIGLHADNLAFGARAVDVAILKEGGAE